MSAVQDILFGVADQVLVCDAMEGRPSSVTSVKVYRYDQSDDDMEELAPTGIVEANPSTTTDAAAGYDQADPRLIPLTATTGCQVGRSYLLTAATLKKEWVEVLEIESGASVTARHPLHNSYASGSSFVSTRITAPVDSTWVSDETNMDSTAGANPMFRVRWVYVVDSVTYVQDTYASLVRYAGRHGVTPQDIEAAHPGWLDRLPTDHRNDQGRRLINDAYAAVKLDMYGIDIDDAAIADSEIVDQLVRHKMIELGEWAAVLAGGGDTTRYDLAQRVYQKHLDALIKVTTKAPVRDIDGVARRQTSVGITRR